MTTPYTGGCACRAIRYEVSGQPVMLDCQCRQCQRESGAGHGSHLTFVNAEVKLEGRATTWIATGDGGTLKSLAFCPVCGAPVYTTFPEDPSVFIVRAASLDDPTRYAPQFITWSAAAQPWDHIDPTIPAFPKMPPG